MAKDDAPKKPRWYRTIFDAFGFVRANDPVFLPVWIVLTVLLLGGGVTLGFVVGGVVGHLYSNLAGVAITVLATLILLTARVDRAAFNKFEGTLGGSLAAVQTIRRGWKFEDQPIEVAGSGRAAIFQGVGRGGLVLIGEGGGAARKIMPAARRRIQRAVPSVPVHEFFVGKGHGELGLRELTKAIRGLKKALSRRERTAVEARLRALGGARLPVPKGVDPLRARPDRKALRGR